MQMNQSQFGKHVGCSQQNIGKLIKKGVIKLNENRKIDVESAKQSLRDNDLLDDKGKLKKSRTPKRDKNPNIEPPAALPFNGPIEYDSYEGKSQEEIAAIEEEKEKAHNEYKEKKKEAESKGITIGDENIDTVTYSDAKAHREKYMGKMAEFDYLIKVGEYVPKEQAERTLFEAARTVRDALLSYPNKMALRVVGKTDIRIIEDILLEELHNILENLSNES